VCFSVVPAHSGSQGMVFSQLQNIWSNIAYCKCALWTLCAAAIFKGSSFVPYVSLHCLLYLEEKLPARWLPMHSPQSSLEIVTVIHKLSSVNI
jgi:hypothetical protein